MAVDVYQALKDLIQRILSSRDSAAQYAEDPTGVLAAQGITDGDVSQVNIPALVNECANSPDVPEGARQALQSYGSGGAAPSHHQITPPPTGHAQSVQEVVQHLNYVTHATYEGDQHITQQLINQENYDYSTNIDNSVDVQVDGDVDGDIEIETTNVTATGDGAVAAGDDVENVATGDGAQVIDGDVSGIANTGDGAVIAGRDIEAPVNTGEFTGVQADGDVSNAIVGDGNQAAQVGGDAEDSAFNFGEGDVTNFGSAMIDDAAVAVGGGDASNVSDNELYEGSAIATGDGDATGSYEYDQQDTYIEADHSIVATEQGAGDQEQESEVSDEAPMM